MLLAERGSHDKAEQAPHFLAHEAILALSSTTIALARSVADRLA